MVSSIGATRMPWRAKILASYFMFWPIFRIAGSSSTGFSSGQRLVQRHLARDQIGRAEQVAAALPVAQRDIAGLPGLDAERDAHQIGAHLVKAGGFGVHGDMAALADQGDPAVQRRRRRARAS